MWVALETFGPDVVVYQLKPVRPYPAGTTAVDLIVVGHAKYKSNERTHHVRILVRIGDADVCQLDIQELIDGMQCSTNADKKEQTVCCVPM